MNLYIDKHANHKNETIIIGLSEAALLFANNAPEYNELTFTLAATNLTYKELYYMLKYYLKRHSEVKKVYFCLGFDPYFLKTHNPEYVEEESKIKKLIKKAEILLSIQPVSRRILNIFNKNENDYTYYNYHPYQMVNYTKEKRDYNKIKDFISENEEYIRKTIEELQSRNIEYTFFIPPYNAIITSSMYVSKDYYDLFERQKRYIVNNFGPIYDFSRLNKYTTLNLLDGSNYLYLFPNHPTELFSYIILNALFYNHNPEKDLYYLETKDTIEDNLKNEKTELEKFTKKNGKYIYNYSKNISKNHNYRMKFYIPDAMDKIKDDREYFMTKYQEYLEEKHKGEDDTIKD